MVYQAAPTGVMWSDHRRSAERDVSLYRARRWSGWSLDHTGAAPTGDVFRFTGAARAPMIFSHPSWHQPRLSADFGAILAGGGSNLSVIRKAPGWGRLGAGFRSFTTTAAKGEVAPRAVTVGRPRNGAAMEAPTYPAGRLARIFDHNRGDLGVEPSTCRPVTPAPSARR
jgi:hypothetical protein